MKSEGVNVIPNSRIKGVTLQENGRYTGVYICKYNLEIKEEENNKGIYYMLCKYYGGMGGGCLRKKLKTEGVGKKWEKGKRKKNGLNVFLGG